MEAAQYIKDIEKGFSEDDERNGLKFKCPIDDIDKTSARFQDNNKEDTRDDHDLFTTETQKFVETFSTIGSWPVSNTNCVKNVQNSLDADITEIYSNFSKLKEILETNDELSNMSIPNGLRKTDAQLNEMVEDTVVCMEELLNIYTQ